MAWTNSAIDVPMAHFDQDLRMAITLGFCSAVFAEEQTFHELLALKTIRVSGQFASLRALVVAVDLGRRNRIIQNKPGLRSFGRGDLVAQSLQVRLTVSM